MNTLTAPSRQRRRLLHLAALGPLLGSALPRALAAPQVVTVVTSYPDEFVSRVEAAFEAANPGYRLNVIWRNAADAADFLRQPDHGGADVYWSPSPRNFAQLAQAGVWRPLPIDRASLPTHIGHTPLGDRAGFYTASEVAGFGFAIVPDWFTRNGVPPPADWPDLTDPRLAGRIALPIPSQVGYAPPMVEIVLQAWGWDKGWALWSEIAGNAAPITRASTFVSDLVADGRYAVGLSIDFFVNSAIANGHPVRFVYPAHTGLNPAHIALTRAAPNAEGAARFVAFILSPAGQQLLRHADIRRLPVRPDAYASGGFNPFAAAASGGMDFDAERARPRLALSSAVFDAMLVTPHGELATLWQDLHRAEANGHDLGAVRRLLGTPPLDAAAADDPALQQRFAERDPTTTQLLAAWQRDCATRRDEARRLLQGRKS